MPQIVVNGKSKDALVDFVKGLHLPDYGLDDIVTNCFTSQAADINNQGTDGQVEYLLTQMSPDEVEVAIREAAEELFDGEDPDEFASDIRGAGDEEL